MDATAAPVRPAALVPTPSASDAPEIRLEGISKVYADGTVGVAELDLTFAAGELTVLVGPSGCGKTTTMKMINRIIEPTTGRVLLDGEDVTRVDADRLRRRIGYVIQNVGLFPHRTVRANVATVPRLLGWDRRTTRARVDELLTTVGLDPAVHGNRYPAQLSGGQRQRAGVARALAADPGVLLMDEPFSAVDPVVRERLQDEFLRLQSSVRKTIVFVTHDIEEAVRLGDRIAIMSAGGHVEQFAPPADLLGRPASPFVADFVGADRGLKRLAVTLIDPADLDHPPVVHAGTTLGEAAAALAGAAGAVVLDGAGRPCGWLPAGRAGGSGTVAAAMRPIEEPVPVSATLKAGLSVLLRQDVDAVPVVDGGSYLGVLTAGTVHATLRRSVASSG
ncbi:ABC transporter ATP-binding protein [Trujillonella endophytica]|uniref:ABC-type quaternary amine transporter n=1 Tax=Trujillonella endophytica TaxID=673521 RepID=A0A1H8V1Z7_9ACTN|nr:ATP-binding cassette domain-containing protein [Trujillella endophytica]SEP08788.1 osmoprotectant transport system ATP-binding protein [Trujillella endophytica]